MTSHFWKDDGQPTYLEEVLTPLVRERKIVWKTKSARSLNSHSIVFQDFLQLDFGCYLDSQKSKELHKAETTLPDYLEKV